MKLIKLTDTHFVIVDDSEIKCPSIVCEKLTNGNWEVFQIDTLNDIDKINQKMITHSTEPLNHIGYKGIRTLSTKYVKELIGEVDVEKKANYWALKNSDLTLETNSALNRGFKGGYNQCLEDNKGKKYTKEDMINAFRQGTNVGAACESLIDYDNDRSGDSYEDSEQYYKQSEESFIQYLSQPKTEWGVEFIDGELKLK